jgi:hypothetical protein
LPALAVWRSLPSLDRVLLVFPPPLPALSRGTARPVLVPPLPRRCSP